MGLHIFELDARFKTRLSATSREDADRKLREHLAEHPERLRITTEEITDYDDLTKDKIGN